MSKTTMNSFYSAFQEHDARKMGECYHPKVTFSDPVFKNLNAEETKAMWAMLIDTAKENLKIDYHSVIADKQSGECIWEAFYPFSKTGNEVHNIIHTKMKFQDGLIIEHHDHFNFWRWSSMALGTAGLILGWTPFLKSKVRNMAMRSLKKYMIEKTKS